MTIEERAYEKALKMLKPNSPTTRELLVEIATEQRKIDIEKACAWLENALNGDNIEGCRDGKKLISEFKKEMEALG